ncbi:hypothetical protein PG991_000241 [Apiospora marii]|uniref:Uncharacterized protein n=1 Tax=Apiospora marii TaxID=335849 RepID=A0ABR1T1K5_9PEZI
MASMIARRAFSTSTRRLAQVDANLKAETKRNPELYILGGVMCAALGGAGLYFGRTPTKSTSEAPVNMSKEAMPWETGSEAGKYQYHPGGDPANAPKDAPSAVNVVVVPDVDLPKVGAILISVKELVACEILGLVRTRIADQILQRLHDKYNKWGKDGY